MSCTQSMVRGRIAGVLGFLLVAALLMLPGVAIADSSTGADPAALSAEQESLARSIEGELIAPCCYTQTVALHASDKSEEIKAQIRSMVVSGSDKGEIIGFFKDRYGTQILAAPEKSGFNLMAYIFPTLITLFALAGIVVLLHRWRRQEDSVEAVRVPVEHEGPDPLRERLDEELRRFDG